MKNTFAPGSFVWAKVDGYSWWPGLVKSISNKMHEVQFFGDFSRAFLKPNKLRDFGDKTFDSLKSKPKLQKAMSQVTLIQEGLSTFEEEVAKVEQELQDQPPNSHEPQLQAHDQEESRENSTKERVDEEEELKCTD